MYSRVNFSGNLPLTYDHKMIEKLAQINGVIPVWQALKNMQ